MTYTHKDVTDTETSGVDGTVTRQNNGDGPCWADLLALNTCSRGANRSLSKAFISEEAEDVNVSV